MRERAKINKQTQPGKRKERRRAKKKTDFGKFLKLFWRPTRVAAVGPQPAGKQWESGSPRVKNNLKI